MIRGKDEWTGGLPVLVTAFLVLLTIVGGLVVTGYGEELADRYLEDDPPQASFAFSYDAETDRLRIEHAGGDEIPGARLTVAVDDEPIANFSQYETVTVGDAVTIPGVEPSAEVEVVYRGDDRSFVIARWA